MSELIKCIAVDLDGTFLDDQRSYDDAFFQKIYSKMCEQNRLFIVSSGNQIQRIRALFPKISENIGIVSENGANIVYCNQTSSQQFIPQAELTSLLEIIDKNPLFKDTFLTMSGSQNAYYLKKYNRFYKEKISLFYQDIVEVDDFSQIEESILKLAFNFNPSVVNDCVAMINQYFNQTLYAVTSGHIAVDVVVKGVNKGTGLERLLKHIDVSFEDVASFGDNMNDAQMIVKSGVSFAMANGKPEIKALADEVIGTNNEQAVLLKIEEILNGNYDKE